MPNPQQSFPRVIRRYKLPLMMMGGITVYAVGGYTLLLGWSIREAAYMTAITLSTIGYKEVRPLGPGGEVFTISVILLGITTMFAFLGATTEVIMSGQLQESMRRTRVRHQIEHLHDHFIICGFGRVGRAAAEEFGTQGIQVLVIDNNPERLKMVLEAGVRHLAEDATRESTLRRAGIERARGLVCALDSDALNVYVTLTGRSLRGDLVIVARASAPESVNRLYRAGADRVVQPYQLSGKLMASVSMRPAVVDFLDLVSADENLRLEELMVRTGAVTDGLPVSAVSDHYPGVTVLAVRPAGGGNLVAAPPGDTLLGPGDLVVALGPVSALQDMSA